MRYSRDQVKPMTQDEYEFATCNAGFSLEFHGKQLGCPIDKSTFGGAIVFAPEAVDYLKRVGLLDNGQCPLCYVREETLCTSNPQLLGLSAFFACKARNNHLVAHVLVQQKRLRHKSPLPHKAA